jgi:hypothetical protein
MVSAKAGNEVALRPYRGMAVTIPAIPAGNFVLMSALLPKRRGAASNDPHHSQRKRNYQGAAFTTRPSEDARLRIIVA